MAWKITTLTSPGATDSNTVVHSTAGDTDKIIVQCDNATPTITGASLATIGTTTTADLWDSSANVPKEVSAYPFIHCIGDSTNVRTFIIAERVKDPS